MKALECVGEMAVRQLRCYDDIVLNVNSELTIYLTSYQ